MERQGTREREIDGDMEREGGRVRERELEIWRGSKIMICYSLYLYQVGEPFDVYAAVQQVKGVGSQSTCGH